jgi:hypothetical protein
MEVPVVSRGVRLVTDTALRRLVAIANEKHAANAARAERLVERFTAVFGAGLEPKPASPGSSLSPGTETGALGATGAGAGAELVDPRFARVEAAQRRVLAGLDAIDAAVSEAAVSSAGGDASANVRMAAVVARASRLAAAGAAAAAGGGEGGGGGGGDWIFFVDKVGLYKLNPVDP